MSLDGISFYPFDLKDNAH